MIHMPGYYLLDTLDRAAVVNGLTDDVDDTTEGLGADGDHDGVSGVDDLLATNETLGTVHGNAADSVLTQVLGDLEDEAATLRGGLALTELDVESVEDRREVLRVELNVDDGTNDRLDGTGLEVRGGSIGADSVHYDKKLAMFRCGYQRRAIYGRCRYGRRVRVCVGTEPVKIFLKILHPTRSGPIATRPRRPARIHTRIHIDTAASHPRGQQLR
jgi:hypothetical protein